MFELKIKTGGAAFRDTTVMNRKGEFPLDESAYEVRRLLKYVEALLTEGISSGVLMDINGNCIGEWRYGE